MTRRFPRIGVASVATGAAALGMVLWAPATSARSGKEGHVVLIDARTGAFDRDFPDADGVVHASVADGHGGWFIGGEFKQVGHVSRPGLARLRASGELDRRFAPSVSGPLGSLIREGGTVWALARHGDVVYEGDYRGVFAFDARTGRQLWMTGASARNATGVAQLTFGNRVLYVVGGFTRVGGVARNGVAALDPQSGKTLAWSVDVAPRTVITVAASRGLVYVGGVFSLLGGKLRTGLGSVSAKTGEATGWAPYTKGGEVDAIAVVGDEILAGGHGGFVAVDAHTGRPHRWPERLRGVATCFAVLGSTVYLGGNVRDGFTGTGTRRANNLAAVQLPEGRFTSWTPHLAHYMNVFTLAVSGHTVLAGGSFTRTLVNGP
jgi:outer membrane protein assembly factor BamB